MQVELPVSRVIRTEAATRLRDRQLTLAAIALEGIERPDLGAQDLRDRLAFVSLALAEVQRSVEQTADAWEKRGYWVKADRFRTDWMWLPERLQKLDRSLAEQKLDEALRLTRQFDGHFPAPSGRLRSSSTTIWSGAWARWNARGR